MKNYSKIILISIIAAGIIGAGLYFLLLRESQSDEAVAVLPDELFGWKFPTSDFPPKTISPSPVGGRNLFDFEIAFSSIRDPGGIPRGLPVRLKIPVIGVDSAIEDALITPDGRMDVPAGSVNVAWFALGPTPGKVGSAVIGGHYGIRNSKPFVFYKLDNLEIGDKIYIEDDRGNTLAFQVRSIKLFDRNADATTVFTSDDGLAHLNLITCEGIWNQVNGSYPSRRVVFTDAIPMLPTTAIPSPLPLLTLTPMTVSSPTPTPTPIPTPIPVPAPTPPPTLTGAESIPTSHIPTKSLKSLFATPFDGIITSILLLLIIFIIFKIIKIIKINPIH